ncbi:MAG: hypothetical protein ACT4QF_24545 [Sporichthyaceae bacterium]
MGQTRQDAGDSSGRPARDVADYVPSFELIPLEDGSEPDASLFDFGPDLARPDGAPEAVLPPWMEDRDAPMPGEGDGRRSRRRGQSLPRARRHRRSEDSSEAAAVERVAEPVDGVLFDEVPDPASMEDTRDVDVTAVIAAEIAAERARKAAAGAGRDVPSQAPGRPERPANPPVTILSSTAVPAQPVAHERPIASAKPVPSAKPVAFAKASAPGATAGPAKPGTPAPPRTEVRTTAPEETPAPRRKYVAAILIAGALIGGGAAWTLSGSGTTEVVSDVAVTGSALAAKDWVNANLGEKSSLLAPASVVSALKKADFDAEKLVPYPDAASAVGSEMPDWRCCNVLLASAPNGVDLRDALPSALRNSYDRSRLIATFTGGGTVTEIRQVLDGTPEAVAAALKAEKSERIAAGKEIATIAAVKLSKAAKADLVAGRVDSRVMLALVGMSRLVEVHVLDFPIDAADKAAGAPARSMRIDKLDGKGIAVGGVAASKAFDFLDAQVDPYRPAEPTFEDAEGNSEGQLMRIDYDAPGTLGLIRPRD